MVATMIKLAAVKPQERMDFITSHSDSILSCMRLDSNAAAFGLHGVNPEPMSVTAKLLPPAKLQYNGDIVSCNSNVHIQCFLHFARVVCMALCRLPGSLKSDKPCHYSLRHDVA